MTFQGWQHDAMSMCSGVAQDVLLKLQRVWWYISYRQATWVSTWCFGWWY